MDILKYRDKLYYDFSKISNALDFNIKIDLEHRDGSKRYVWMFYTHPDMKEEDIEYVLTAISIPEGYTLAKEVQVYADMFTLCIKKTY